MNCQSVVIFVLLKLALAQNNTGPPKVTIYTNERVHISTAVNCHVDSSSNSTKIQWYKNNAVFDCVKPGSCMLTTSHTKEEYWSNITLYYPNEGENFTCVAENLYGKSSDTLILHCVEGSCLQWVKGSQMNYTKVNVGQSVSISCHLVSQKRPLKECFKFGVHHHNHSYNIQDVSITPNKREKEKTVLSYSIKYIHNISNIGKSDSGVYTCFYQIKRGIKESHCPKRTSQSFIVVVTEPSSGEKDHKRHHIIIAIAVSVGSVLVGLALTVLVFCLHAKKQKSQRLYESELELRWDVFISYSSKDFDWVKELCKTLEQPPFHLAVCMHQRDWEVGKTILDNMAESIYCSQKTLLVVSKSYLESSFCLQELNIAADCDKSTQKILKDRIIVIKLDDVSLKNLPKTLKAKSYLDFSDSEQRKHFKTKLLRALPIRVMDDEMLPESAHEGLQDERESRI